MSLAPEPLVLRASKLYRICSFCKSVRSGTDWIDPAAYLSQSATLLEDPPPRLSHGLCPACFSSVMAENNRMAKEAGES